MNFHGIFFLLESLMDQVTRKITHELEFSTKLVSRVFFFKFSHKISSQTFEPKSCWGETTQKLKKISCRGRSAGTTKDSGRFYKTSAVANAAKNGGCAAERGSAMENLS